MPDIQALDHRGAAALGGVRQAGHAAGSHGFCGWKGRAPWSMMADPVVPESA